MNKQRLIFCFLFAFLFPLISSEQVADPTFDWHGKERSLHYMPEGEDFVCINGKQRFNRALYGTNTAFRVEAGDLPEFALYMPGMGGNFKIGIAVGDKSKWITEAQNIKAIYRPGSMIYEIQDSLLGNGSLKVTVLALSDKEGMLVKTEFTRATDNLSVIWAYGGASGKKFSRDGDIGADPESSFYMQPDYCRDNVYKIEKNVFRLSYGSGKILSEQERYEVQHMADTSIKNEKNSSKQLLGTFPSSSTVRVGDARLQSVPLQLLQSSPAAAPVACGTFKISGNDSYYFCIENPSQSQIVDYKKLPLYFIEAESSRVKLAGRIKVNTPDPFINTLGGALSVAADAIWEDPSYLHGAVAWRMRLNAWRGAYVADPLGWHDRARKHFSSYALSQIRLPESGPVVSDTALHLARQLEKVGTSLFSNGYISRNPGGDIRAHHYDMNLVFVDQLLNHFFYTGDTAFARQVFPLLKRHLAWEKRNFDVDGDGLYDAYAAIWASDALQYSGGGVTHSSAYNYKANKIVAELAAMVGEDPLPYRAEADHILQALNSKLWMPAAGSYGEYKDLLGLQRVHPAAGIWTIYHAIDSRITNPFQAYQSLRYIDTHIPHIPVRAKGLADSSLYLLSTSNWQPYTWSINNVALAEVLHTSLAYWQGGRSVDAYHLWKSAVVESMYLSSSPAGFQQLSFYDAIRGELYRDFADPVGMAARTLVEGLFGINPDLLHDTLYIKPGYPLQWNKASIATPDISYDFNRMGNIDIYTIRQTGRQVKLHLELPALYDTISEVLLNGKPVKWRVNKAAIGTPSFSIDAEPSDAYLVTIQWAGRPFEKPAVGSTVAVHEKLVLSLKQASLSDVYDPGNVLENTVVQPSKLSAVVNTSAGEKTVFVRLQQGMFNYWYPVNFTAKKHLEIVTPASPSAQAAFYIKNNAAFPVNAKLKIGSNNALAKMINIRPHDSIAIVAAVKDILPGTNLVLITGTKGVDTLLYTNWETSLSSQHTSETYDLSAHFNDQVSNIFKNEYLSPRPAVPTLQLPTQGIGNWCYPLTTAHINDSGLRQRAGSKGEITTHEGIRFATPSAYGTKNIAFTSLWDNYPDSILIPVNGKSTHAYLLMAGSTNPMQSRFVNAEIVVKYRDGKITTLPLKNPDNWWPIEQDYYLDGYAFTAGPIPTRVHLQTGADLRTFNNYTTIKGFSNRAIDGGAATVLDLPLDPAKELQSIMLRTLANDVVIGLMSVTLVRK